MRKRIVIILALALLIAISFQYCECMASDLGSLKGQMSNVGDYGDASGTGIGKIINSVIGIIQFTGSGIAIIVVSILGIKYLLSSPTERADIKKMAVPIIIGCVLLFGCVNLAAMIYDFATGAFGGS